MVRRPLSDAERQLFESAMGDAALLKKAHRRHKAAKSAKLPRSKTRGEGSQPEHVQAPQVRARRTLGIDGNTSDRLRRGQLEPRARLDLHGMSARDAHRALVTFVRAASARKLRLLLVVTGKGSGGQHSGGEAVFDLGLDTQARGILRSLTPRWLREPGLVEMIADVREAHRRHGGSGALYVYLRKGEER